MLRLIACAALTLGLGVAASAADKSAKPQMVKGTVKSADRAKSLLVINQVVKNEKVDRELSILPTTEFSVTINGETKTATGKDGLDLLEGKEGAQVQVKCDKDVNVLKVTAKVK